MDPIQTGPAPAAEARIAKGISGTTAVIPLIGHPVAQVKSPPVLNAHFDREDLDVVVTPMDIPPEATAGFFALVRAWSNCAGVSITVPHKQAAWASVDTLTARARATGAVNAIRRDADGSLHGDNTDGVAFVAALANHGFAPEGQTCLVVGAGGAGSAIAHALAEFGAACIVLHDIDAGRRATLAQSIRATHPRVLVEDGIGDLARFDLAVNGSTLGMRAADPLPFDPAGLNPRCMVADVVTTSDITPVLALARGRGLRIQTGAEMAAAQRETQCAWFAVSRYARQNGAGR